MREGREGRKNWVRERERGREEEGEKEKGTEI